MTRADSHFQCKYAACSTRRLKQSMSNSPRDTPCKHCYKPNSPPYQYQTKMKMEAAEDPSSQRDKRKRATNMYSNQVFQPGATTSSLSLVCTLCLRHHANNFPNCNATSQWDGSPLLCNGTTECDWSTGMEPSSALNGSYQEAARAACMHLDTSALAVVPSPMEPSTVLMHRRLPEPPFHGCYDPSAWEQQLAIHGLYAKYKDISHSLCDMALTLAYTHAPSNHRSIEQHAVHFCTIVDDELAKERYFGPFSRANVE